MLFITSLPICASIANKSQIGFTSRTETSMAEKLNELADKFYDSIQRLEERVNKACLVEGARQQAEFFHDYVLAEMDIMREIADEIELIMPRTEWPIPTYSEMIYNV